MRLYWPKQEAFDGTWKHVSEINPNIRKLQANRLPIAVCQQRARALLRDQLKHGPKPGAQIEAAARAAEIPEHSLIAAADALGVRTRRGQWWLPG